MSSKLDALGKMTGLKFLMFSGTGESCTILDFENGAVMNLLVTVLISA